MEIWSYRSGIWYCFDAMQVNTQSNDKSSQCPRKEVQYFKEKDGKYGKIAAKKDDRNLKKLL